MCEKTRSSRHGRVLAIAVALAAASAAGTAAGAEQAPPPAPAQAAVGTAGDAAAGERLFSGRTRFANRGPPCAGCHPIATLPFPGGGTLGPDLTGTWDKYGPDALDTVLATLYFPTMSPIFAGRLPTPAERADLEAFFAAAAAAGRSAARPATAWMLVVAVVLCALALALAAVLARGRLRGVRASLVRARRSRGVGP